MSERKEKCANCGAALKGEYCHICGEQKLNPHLRSLRHIASDIVEELTSLDGKVFRTVSTLSFYPGRYEFDYHKGKRVSYLKPIALFFIINILFVAFSPITDFYVSFENQLDYQFYSKWTKPTLVSYIQGSGLTIESFAAQYDQLVVVIARSLIILQVPFFAILMAIIAYRKGYFAGDYFTFALNINSWVLCWIVLAQLPAFLLAFPLGLFVDGEPMWQAYTFFLLVGMLLYISIALKVMFQLSWIGSLLRLPIVIIALFISHMIYRLCQLIITSSLVSV